MNENSRVKFSLSLEPAFQVIYWSICWLLFFSLLIVALETQTFNLILIFMVILVGILIFYGLGSTLQIKNDSLKISYYRGIYNKFIPIDEIKKITFSAKREVNICLNQDNVVHIYLNIKNKKKFYEYLKKNAPLIFLEEKNNWDELSKFE
ncbi:MAG: EbsA family protein [Carnobacterium sp.]|uniref:EbsA family protein n=1 Tax=Carnobacterium sp. TaxID=48221 RepID=UPI0033161860